MSEQPMNEMNDKVKELLRTKMIPALLSVVLGIALIIARKAALDVLVQIIGWILIVGAVGFVAAYFLGPYKDKTGLIAAVLAGLAGVLFITQADAIDDFLLILVGVVLILNGLGNVASAFVEGQNRLLVGIIGALIVVLGVLIITHPGSMMNAITVYMGISLILNGILDLFLLYRMKEMIR